MTTPQGELVKAILTSDHQKAVFGFNCGYICMFDLKTNKELWNYQTAKSFYL